MKKEFIEYVNSIGLTDELMTKVENVINFYTNYLKCTPDDIFVSEYLNSDGSRFYENILIFSENFCGEAKFFLTQEDYDLDLIKNNVIHFSIKLTDFDAIKDTFNVNSRMFVTFSFYFDNDRRVDLKASKENCKHLSFIFKKYIQPNQWNLVQDEKI